MNEPGKHLPRCILCGKQSDGAQVIKGPVVLCGTDYDLWKKSPEGKRSEAQKKLDPHFLDFVTREQGERRNGSKTP